MVKRDFSNKWLYNEKYIPILTNKKRYVFLMGSAGSWKSVFVAQKEIIKTYGKNRLLATRKIKDTLKDSMYKELTTVIEKWGLQSDFNITQSPLYIQNKLTGSDILFRWMDDPEKVKSVSWVTRIRLEEATEFTKEDMNQLDLRLRGKWDLQMTFTFNPISDQHRTITDFRNKWNTKDVECMHSTYKDNRFVGQEKYEISMNRLKKQDIRLYNIYALGIPWKAVEWLVFDKYEIIKEIPAEAKLKGVGLDFWYNDPTALIDIYEYEGKIILDERLYKTHLTNEDIIKFLKANDVKEDTEIVWDNSRPESIEEIARAGFYCVPCKKWKDSIMHWIQLMKQYDILITARSQNIKKELDNYTRAKDKHGNAIEKPIDAFNHWIDASRYGIIEFFTADEEFEVFIW